MKPKQKYLHLYGELHDGQWTMMCLDFTLAVQSDSLQDAQQKIHEQIDIYIKDALVGQDKDYTAMFLNRSAPAKYWIKFYWYSVVQHFFKLKNSHIAENMLHATLPA